MIFALSINIAKAFWISEVTGKALYLVIISVLIASAPKLIFLLASGHPKWKPAISLFFLGLYEVVMYCKSIIDSGVGSLEMVIKAYVEGFSEYPLATSVDILSWVFTLLVLATAIWLTLVPKNRELSEQSEKLILQLKEYAATNRS